MAKKKQQSTAFNETEELENAYRDITGYSGAQKPSKTKKRTGLLIAGCIMLIVIVVGLVLGVLLMEKLEKMPILENVKVAGIDVGGMTVDQAAAAVTQAIGGEYANKDVTLQVFDSTVTIPASYSGGTLDVKKAVRAARNYGQVGFPNKIREEKQIAATAGYTVNLAPYMNINEDAIMDTLNKLSEKYSSTLRQSTWKVEGKAPTADDLAAEKVDLKLVIALGTPEYGLSIERLYQQITDAYSTRQFSIVGDCTITEPDAIDLEGILGQHQILAQDAYLHPETYEPVESHNGCGFDLEAAKKALSETPYGSELTIPFQVTKPELTTQELKDRMFRDTLSTFTAKSTSSAARKTNLRLACEAVNGVILNPGDEFDYNKVVGERTAARGYKAAAAYVSGETVQTIGGGVCQVSSTIYYCALMADLEIVTRRNHSYRSSYIPLGMDATVSWGGPEFRFRNNSDHPIKIVASASGGNVTVSIMSYDDRDYYVKMEYEVLSKTGYSTVYKTFPANNSEGYKDGEVITTPYTGYTVNSYRVKYSKETDQEISRTFEAKSAYKHRDRVIAKVESPAPAPAPVPTPGTGAGTTSSYDNIVNQVG